jgi:hypothetical protein
MWWCKDMFFHHKKIIKICIPILFSRAKEISILKTKFDFFFLLILILYIYIYIYIYIYNNKGFIAKIISTFIFYFKKYMGKYIVYWEEFYLGNWKIGVLEITS